jgi:hypothetical protein
MAGAGHRATEGDVPAKTVPIPLGVIAARRTPSMMVPSVTGPGSPPLPASIGGFRPLRVLGIGGMGIVYEAEAPIIHRRVALKILTGERAGNARAVERFLREAAAAGSLMHPNVVTVLHVGLDTSGYYMVMEMLGGGSAQDRLDREERFTPASASRITADACRALGAAHASGLVHRDVKPSNILLTADGGAKLADFGMVKMMEPMPGAQALTAAGMIPGTPDYVSPEVCRAQPADARSDLYSLGVTYFVLLTGQRPYPRALGPIEVLAAHCMQPMPDPRTVDPTLPEACSFIVRRATEKDPAHRYQSAAEMLRDLERVTAMAAGGVGDAGVRQPSGRTQPTVVINARPAGAGPASGTGPVSGAGPASGTGRVPGTASAAGTGSGSGSGVVPGASRTGTGAPPSPQAPQRTGGFLLAVLLMTAMAVGAGLAGAWLMFGPK